MKKERLMFAVVASLVLAALIFFFWFVFGQIEGTPQRVEHGMLSFRRFSHSRLWDAFLGTHAIIICRAFSIDPLSEILDGFVDWFTLVVGAAIGFFLIALFAENGTDAGSWVVFCWAGAIATVIGSVLVGMYGQIRLTAILFTGYAFGLSLVSGAFLGAVMTVGLVVIFALVMLGCQLYDYYFGEGLPI